MDFEFHPNIIEKLRATHQVTIEEVKQCFGNVTRGFLIDDREEHRSDPVTNWFIEETDCGRSLLVAFIHFKDENRIVIKTAYEPSNERKKVYVSGTRKEG